MILHKNRIVDILNGSRGDRYRALGWVRSARRSSQVSFIEINDGSCLSNLQVVFSPPATNDINVGSAVEVTGQLAESQGTKQSIELQGESIAVIGTADAHDYPLQKKRHSFEYLRSIAHLRARSNTFGAVARIRNAISMAIHNFFQTNGFLYVHTPIISGNDAEGGGTLFEVITRDRKNETRFFPRTAYLTVSGQLNAETYASALSRVYTFGPTFRAENSNTRRHLAEFWMVEPEIAFCELDELIEFSEHFLKSIITTILERSIDDLEFFDRRICPGIIDSLRRVVECSFEHIDYDQAIALLTNADQQFRYPVSWGIDLQSEHEQWLTEDYFGNPVFITNWPKDIKAFYMRQNDDGKTVGAMDLLVPRLGEIIGGSQREERYERLANRIDELGMERSHYWWYLDIRRFGTVPHAGFGLGFERFVQYITGIANIRDTIPFPRTAGNLEF